MIVVKLLPLALAAGIALFFFAREAPALFRAWRQGVVMTRSTIPRPVLCNEEPERFRALVRQRLIGAGMGVGVLVAALIAFLLNAAGIDLPSRYG